MPTNKTSIEIEAKGEFSQLTRGLREVKSALSDVTGIVNKGARSGGIFDQKQLKALDLFSQRFQDSMKRMNSLIDTQAEKISQLYNRRRNASQQDIKTIDKEIQKQGEKLDQLERERQELERIYQLRRQEATQFQAINNRRGSSGSGGGGGSDSGGSGSGSAQDVEMLAGFLGKAKGILGKLAMVAGVSIGVSQLLKWEQMAEQNVVAWQNVSQRGVVQGPIEGAGLRFGFNSNQSAAMSDIFSSLSGRASAGDLIGVMRGARAFGVDPNTMAAITGQYAQLGFGSPGDVISRAAGSTPGSMQGRILEVMEAQLGFLQSMDKSLKDDNGNTLLAYTARLNQIGVANHASRLTGASGANLLEQMGANIFNPQDPTWMAMGVNMLSRFGGGATRGMDTFGLMSTWQQGFGNAANISAMGSYLAQTTQGMTPRQAEEYKALFLQRAMGGNTTLAQAQQFGQMTNWLQSFNPSDPKMQSLLKGVGAPGTVAAKANQWQSTLAARIEITNAKWMQAQLEAGKITIPVVLSVKNEASDLLNSAVNAIKGGGGGGGGSFGGIGDIIAAILGTRVAGGLAKKAGELGKKHGDKLRERIEGRGKNMLPPEDRAALEEASTASKKAEKTAGKSILDRLFKSGGKSAGARTAAKVGARGILGAIADIGLGPVADMMMGIAWAGGGSGDPAAQAQSNRYSTYLQRQQNYLAQHPSTSWMGGGGRNFALDDPNAPWNKGLKDLGPIMKETGKTVSGHAKNMADKTISAMDDQRHRTIKAAEETRDKTVGSAQSMRTDVVTNSHSMRSDAKDAWNGMKQDLESILSFVLNTGLSGMGAGMGGFGGDGSMPKTQAQQAVYNELQKQGKGAWWPVVNQLVQRESSWTNQVGATDPHDHQTPYGYFQFKPGTWNEYMGSQWGGNPMQYNPTIQTDAFIRYINARYGGNMAQLIMSTGLGTSSYKGYADGTFVARDQPAIVHSGEEIISRAKTGEVLRKTGRLPSQILNSALSGGNTLVAMGASGSRRLDIHLHLTADENIKHVDEQAILRIAQHVFEEKAAEILHSYPTY